MARYRKVSKLRSHTLYTVCASAIDRCTNTNNAGYKHYGGRGIQVSKEFLDDIWTFIVYLESLPNYENRRRYNLSLDRIENNGNYERGNLRWATIIEQNNNRRPVELWSNSYNINVGNNEG